jgi:nucleotide-binding universal stress UspA family protein
VTIFVAFQRRLEVESALAYALEAARIREASVVIAQVFPNEPNDGDARHSAHWAKGVSHAKEQGDRLKEALQDLGYDASYVSTVSPSGRVGETLLELVRSYQPELVVIGIRHRSPVGKLVLGSIAQDILLGADCPILAVKSGKESASRPMLPTSVASILRDLS